jgi:hypothetical protein
VFSVTILPNLLRFYDNSGGKAHSFRGGMKAGIADTSQLSNFVV